MRAAFVLATNIELPAIYAVKQSSYLELQGIYYLLLYRVQVVFKCLELWSTEDTAANCLHYPAVN